MDSETCSYQNTSKVDLVPSSQVRSSQAEDEIYKNSRANSTPSNRLLIKITRDTLPQVKDKYPFLYLERGRLEIDDSSVKWVDSDANVVRLPIATINCLLLGPGTSVTHEAVKVIGAANCGLCWVGEDSLIFYACGQSPTANSRNFHRQMRLAADKKESLEVARRLFFRRFPMEDLKGKNLQAMMGLEGARVRELYKMKAEQYQVGWKGRKYTQGKFELGTITNQILTSANAALYAILSSAIHSMGYSPYMGFIHSGSPLPFVYDLADLYKEHLCIDLAFFLTAEMGSEYNRHRVAEAFKTRVIQIELLSQIGSDIEQILDGSAC